MGFEDEVEQVFGLTCAKYQSGEIDAPTDLDFRKRTGTSTVAR